MEAIARRVDSTHRMSLLQREYYKATHDPLTGLINHISFDERVEYEIAVCERHHRSFALLMLEISHFNEIAQNYSKTAANNILIDFAKRLRTCVRQTDSVARLEGDIFAVLLPDISEVRHIMKILQSINVNLSAPFSVNQVEHSLVASIGVTFYPLDGDGKDKLLDNAHLAMCQTRLEKVKNYCFYTPAVEDDIRAIMDIEQSLYTAINTKRFDIQYLPIHNAQQNQLSYRQAMVTWHDAGLREQNPQFIADLLNSLDLNHQFADIMLESVCQHIANESCASKTGYLPILIELNRAQWRNLYLVQRAEKILKRYKVAPRNIGFVIYDECIRADTLIAEEQITSLKNAGHQIVLDVSNLGLTILDLVPKQLVDMVRLNIDVLSNKDQNDLFAAIIEGIIGVCRRLQINVLIPEFNQQHPNM